MKVWEVDLQKRYEQDRAALLDYKEIDIEFRMWFFDIMKEEVAPFESGECSLVHDIVCDPGLCDGELVRPVESQSNDTRVDYEITRRIEGSTAEGESIQVIDDMDIYDQYYDEIVAYKQERKTKPKKKQHKRKN